MTKTTFRSAVLAGLAGLLAAGPIAADSVSGEFVLDGKAYKPTEVAAFRVRDQFNPRQFQTYVMLTTKAVDREAIRNSIDPYTTAINDAAVMNDDYLSLHVDADGETSINAHVGGTQYIDTSGKMMGQQGSLSATCATNTSARVVCNVKTQKPVKPMDGPSWTVDVNFDSEVFTTPPGKPIAKGGGAPGAALLALRKAIAGNDLAAITALLTKDEASDYQRDYNTPEENLANAKSMLDILVPKQPKVIGGEMKSDTLAILEVEGVPYEGSKMLYLVEMHLEDGKWVLGSSQMAGMLK